MKIHLRTKYLDDDVILHRSTYPNGSTAIYATDAKTGEPMSKLTVALPNKKPAEGNVFIKDWSENEGVLNALQQAFIVGDVIRTIPTGHVEVYEVPLRSEIGK